MRFELDYLESYDDEALLEELRRVAMLVAEPKVTRSQFVALSKVHSSTIEKRFGGWRAALEAAGLSNRIDESGLAYDRDELLRLLRQTAEELGTSSPTAKNFEKQTGVTSAPFRRVFGSWKSALEAAGLNQSPLGKRYSDEECFENMLAVWTHYGRVPKHAEMNVAPSIVGSKAYTRRWGTWRRALSAFVQRVNRPEKLLASDDVDDNLEKNCLPNLRNSHDVRTTSRDISLSLRYSILKRDSFRCVTCGTSPAITFGVELHIDHIVPWARGGQTIASNLRTLCKSCNLGKGVSPA